TSDLIEISTAKMLLDEEGLPVIAGLGQDEGSSDQRIRIMRYSSSGDLLQETSYLKAYSTTAGITDFLGFSLDGNDDSYLNLNNFYTEKGRVFETVKLNWDSGDTDPDWTSIFETPDSKSSTRMFKIAHDANDNVIATGDYSTTEDNQVHRHFFVAKYDASGNMSWQHSFSDQNGNEAAGISMVINSNDEIIVYLLQSALDTEQKPIRLKKYDPSGNLVWETEKEVFAPNLNTIFLDE